MPLTVNTLEADLLAVIARQESGMAAGLAEHAEQKTQQMRDAAPWQDDTGAARAGLVVAAFGPGQNGQARIDQAATDAEALNPGTVETEAGTLSGAVGLVYTGMPVYTVYLERDNAGRFAIVADTIQTDSSTATEAAARGARKAIGQ